MHLYYFCVVDGLELFKFRITIYNPRITRNNAEKLYISVGSVETLVKNLIKFSKMSARWVFCLLKLEHTHTK